MDEILNPSNPFAAQCSRGSDPHPLRLIVDRFWPTSKTCSSCGRKVDLSLQDRKWTCKCGVMHDRDVNAAKNILAAGQVVPFACGADARPTKNYVLRGSPRRSRKHSQ